MSQWQTPYFSGIVGGVASPTDTKDNSKRRRACDACRRTKVRCDPPESQDIPCTACARSGQACTFVEESKKRGPAKGYVTALEERCRKLELLVKELDPNLDVDERVGPPFTQENWVQLPNPGRKAGPSRKRVPRAASTAASQSLRDSESPPESESTTAVPLVSFNPDLEDPDIVSVVMGMETLDINKGLGSRYHGQGSGRSFFMRALNLDSNQIGTKSPREVIATTHRAKFWLPSPWKQSGFYSSKSTPESIEWPSEDLLRLLCFTFFEKVYPSHPIIHRKSFERGIETGHYKMDAGLARLVLLVCAISSPFVDDPRVCFNTEDGTPDWLSAGWKYFTQIPQLHEPLFIPSDLSRMQSFALVALYLQSIGANHAAWLVTGYAIRCAVDVGLHREKMYTTIHPVLAQIWKRTFWALVMLDEAQGTGLGRPRAIHSDDIDTELPLEFDDEHFDEVTRKWEVPAGQAPIVSGFIHRLRLSHIIARFSLEELKVGKPDLALMARTDHELIMAYSDLPPRFAWDPNKKNHTDLIQSAVLRVIFHSARMSIRRPSLALWGDRASTPESNLALEVCVTSALAVLKVLETIGLADLGYTMGSGHCFGAGTFVLLGMWDMKRKDPSNPTLLAYAKAIETSLALLSAAEARSQMAGRVRDVLQEIYFAHKTSSGNKRPRTTDADADDQRPTRMARPNAVKQPFSAAGSLIDALSTSDPTAAFSDSALFQGPQSETRANVNSQSLLSSWPNDYITSPGIGPAIQPLSSNGDAWPYNLYAGPNPMSSAGQWLPPSDDIYSNFDWMSGLFGANPDVPGSHNT